MQQLGANKTDEDFTRMFRFNLNLVRIESLRFWFSENHDSNRTMIRLQEVGFFNAGVLCRIHNQMATCEDFDKAEDLQAKIVIMC